jgi:hypothetical protein
MNILQRYWLGPLFLGVSALATPPTVDAQILVPPINGLTATIALPSSVDAFYKGLNEGLEKAGDGIDHLTRARGTKGREGSGSLGSLRPGTAVAVQYTVKGIQASADETAPIAPNALNVNEGTVTRVDRSRKHVTITFANGATETLRSDNSFTQSSSRVIVYYADETGRRVAHLFKPAR